MARVLQEFFSHSTLGSRIVGFPQEILAFWPHIGRANLMARVVFFPHSTLGSRIAGFPEEILTF